MNARRLVSLIALGSVASAGWFLLRTDRTLSGPLAAASTTLKRPPPADAIGPFYVGISSLDVEENERAGRLFDHLSKEMPAEPAVWANLGLARLRLGDLPGAETALGQAAKLAPDDDRVAILQATIDEYQGRYAQAIQRLQALSVPSVAALYRLAGLLDRTGSDSDLPAQLRVFDRLRKRAPGNPVVAFDRARLLARMENRPQLAEALQAFEAQRGSWPTSAAKQLDTIKAAATTGNFRTVATNLTFLQNLMTATPAYQAALATLDAAGGSIGRPIREFLTFSTPRTVVAPADEALAFTEQPAPATATPPDLYLALALAGKPDASLLTLAGNRLRIEGGTELPIPSTTSPLGPNSVCTADLRGTGLLDLALVDAGGLKIWTQDKAGHFTPFEPKSDVRPAFAEPGHGVWALDFDADGDLDLLVARDGASPRLLRNNGDGSFTALDTFAAFPEIREACWGDFDGDGNGDLAFIDSAGRVQVSWNHRSGAFTPPTILSASPAVALACGDVNGRGDLGLLVLERSGVVRGLDFDRVKQTWSNRELAHWANPPDLAASEAHRRVSLFAVDLDNNGATDLVASAGDATAIWLNQGGGQFVSLKHAPALFVTSVADVDGDGLPDLVGLTGTGAAVARTQGSKGYHWQSIQARARANADGRINTYGIGGRIEIRAGPLLAMAPITAPTTHFGLGENPQVGVARIVWPNGVAQVEFGLQPDQAVTATQRLKGSCPWVFTRTDGTFRFVKDFIWRSPLGMRINSQDTAGVDQTEDWILVPGSSLQPDHGAYELRITAELWEAHFFDHVALKIVDHPAGVSTFVDERFVPAHQPKLAVIATTPPRPFAAARDQSGRDVLATLATSDGHCVADFPLGRYQGIAADHWIEFQLPNDVPADGPLVLVGEGWIYPTDSSLNVAISQGDTPKPHGLVLEDFDPQRGWRATGGDLGFPAGKNKTVVIPIPHESLAAGHRRFRLRTNLEVYWDRLGWAEAEPGAQVAISPAEMLTADLRPRGFSELPAPQRRRPDLPNYTPTDSGPRWQDLEGFYTRYGDIRELLQRTDDRYVIMNAGDEMVLRFAAPATPPPPGWTRDFVLVGDGWVKDGDFNTANSRTVQPLPFHGMPGYASAPEALADDPVYQQHRDDWLRFHTRFVTAREFERGLMHVAATNSATP